MAQFVDIDHSYLTDTVTRVVKMIGIATPNVQALDYIDPNLNPPFWWVYLGQMALGDRSEEISKQDYIIICRYVVGRATEGIDGEVQRSLYASVPAMLLFFQTHRNFMYTDTDGSIPYMNAPKYLNSSLTKIAAASTFGAFLDSLNHVGMEVGISVSFNIGIEQEY